MKLEFNKMSKITQYYLIAAFFVVTVITLLNGVKGKPQLVEQSNEARTSNGLRPMLNKRNDNTLISDSFRIHSFNGATSVKLPNGIVIEPHKQPDLFEPDNGEPIHSDEAEKNANVSIGVPVDHVKSIDTRPPPTKRESNPSDKIHFPNDSLLESIPKLPPSCNGVTAGIDLCSRVDNYPEDKITSILDKVGITFKSVVDELPADIAQRGGFDSGERRLCLSDEQVVYPQSGKRII